MVSHYRILADPNAIDRWHLAAPLDKRGEEVDARIFTCSERYEGPSPLVIPQRRAGRPQNFNFADFDMPVVTPEICRSLASVAGEAVQCIPVIVDPSLERFEILNVLDLVECVDEERSEITKWTEDDGRPDKIGHYRMITKLVLNEKKISDHRIFRVAGWEVALIVDENIKLSLERKKVSGIRFDAVS